MVDHNQTLFCLFCGKDLTGKQEKFCSHTCKDRWWNRKRQEQVKGFDALNSALRKAGFEVRRLPAEEDLSRAK